MSITNFQALYKLFWDQGFMPRKVRKSELQDQSRWSAGNDFPEGAEFGIIVEGGADVYLFDKDQKALGVSFFESGFTAAEKPA